jgi:hypothetical protein
MKAAFFRRVVAVPAVVLAVQLLVPPAGASHAWAGFHWARTANPLQLQLGRNLSGPWVSVLDTTSADWSASAVVDTAVVAGGTNAKRCNPTAGRVEVCNASYGRNGWLGVASVWASGSHVTRATVKVNDSYFSMAKYNTPAWRNSVMCQEVGHTLGLGHNDEDFSTVNGTCMDYADDPAQNQHPNAHDYEQLATIYSHLDTTNTAVSSTGAANRSAASLYAQDEWGRAIRYSSDGRPVVFERPLPQGERLVTFVVWAR